MGMFRRKTELHAASDHFTGTERERVDALWRLTALPGVEFNATDVAAPQGEAWTELKHEALTCAVAGLREPHTRLR